MTHQNFRGLLAIMHCQLRIFLCLWILSWLVAPVWARLSPHAPVRDFKLPRFAENGYTEWVLQGSSGQYVNPELIHISDMALRIYSADERMLRELALESDFAALQLQENTARSQAPIHIEGVNFNVAGTGWIWNGSAAEIEVLSDVLVDFQQSIASTLRAQAVTTKQSTRSTQIQSEQLHLQTLYDQHRFTFKNSVRVLSDSMQMLAGWLQAHVNLPSQDAQTTSNAFQAPQDFSAIQTLQASRGVEIIDRNRRIVSQEAVFEPQLNQAQFSGRSQLEFPGIQLSGDHMQLRSGAINLYAGSGELPAKMRLQQKAAAVEEAPLNHSVSLIEVSAQQIEIEEQTTQIRLHFKDTVNADSEGLQLKANELVCRVNQAQAGTSILDSKDASLQFADMQRLQASGSVEVFLHQQHAQADAMDYDPATTTAYLSGSPRLSQGLYRVKGHKMQLNKLASLVEGVPNQLVHVILPPLQASPLPAVDSANLETDIRQSDEALPTVITSLNLKHTQDASKTVFEFTDSVRITGKQLEAQCEKLIVYAAKNHENAQLTIERMEADGDVRMVYDGRAGQSDRAVMDRIHDRVILLGNAQFEDPSGIVSGHKITYSQSVGVQVESDPDRKQRNTIQLQNTGLSLPQ